ncbi:Kef-type K+ transport system membrane component KefB [Halomonas fontilapidosi]|uniref:Kef-type K+ transport system membrane component KefB n=1 Tax=Halomonas fontilapidosi TaxID=616675 RepID=A0A7W5DLJ5_9GAMM|nr:cation:proton antiporter [Halomonas fontilapidosi]MBB3185096.1 Kef-type K+ transport system membrane component KefB [Halomonas fontilapidosi]
MQQDILHISDTVPLTLILGAMLLVGWFSHIAGEKTGIPRVTVLLVIGVLAGPDLLDLVPEKVSSWFDQVTHLALAMVGFLLGERFIGRELKRSGRKVLIISLGEVVAAAAAVFLATQLIGLDPATGLLLAAMAPASAPASTLDVIQEKGASGPLSRTVLGVVAIDDAWGVILFSLLLVLAQALDSDMAPVSWMLSSLWEVLGGIALGVILGVPMSWMTGRLREGEPTLLEASGFVLLCGGIALWLNLSYLLACMALGATVANRAKHYKRPFSDIKGAVEPFMVMFFLLAGFKMDIDMLPSLGVIGLVYIASRTVGLVGGGALASSMAGADPVVRRNVGWCLLSQAGVALGLALLVEERFPEIGSKILPLVIGSTIIFELLGPVFVRWRLKKAGELPS